MEDAMEADRVKKNVRTCSMLLGSFACLIVLSMPIMAQSGGDSGKVQMQEMTKRELQLNNLGRDKGRPNASKVSQAFMDQVKNDFQRILTLHNEMVRAIAANQPVSNRFISDATGEIRKRSTRLQSSLRLKPESKPGNEGTRANLKMIEAKDELILLCKDIESFVRNPIIENPGTVDAQQLEKARKDLQSVVDLSDAIKKRADKQKP
jgi:hypothetical protein